jgi:hypothetical protein
MLLSPGTLVAALLLLSSAGSSDGDRLPACTRFKSRLLVMPETIRRGVTPDFVLELENTGSSGVRLLDVRNGRRPDLAATYYAVVVRTMKGSVADGPRAISDPGPIAASDFFVLEPSAKVSLHLRSLVELEALAPGSYVASVSIWQDPYAAGSRCRSGEAKFRVVQPARDR